MFGGGLGGGSGGGGSGHLDHTGGGSDGVVAVDSLGHDNRCGVGCPIGDGGVVSRVGSGVGAANTGGGSGVGAADTGGDKGWTVEGVARCSGALGGPALRLADGRSSCIRCNCI